MPSHATRLLGLTALLLLFACNDADRGGSDPAAPAAEPTANAATMALVQLFTDEWQQRMQRYPRLASRMGEADANDRLEDVSASAQQNYAEQDAEILARLHTIDRAALSTENQLNYDLFDFIVGHRVKLNQYHSYRIPFLSDSGFHMGVQRMYESMP